MNFTATLQNGTLKNGNDINYGHTLSPGFSIFVGLYFIFLSFTGASCNLILMWTIIRRRRLHTITNVFITNLAICDFIAAIVIVPQDADYILRGYYNGGTILCGFKEVAFMFSLPSSVASLLLLTSERCCKVICPFTYQYLFTKRNVIKLITAVWCYTILVALFPIMYDHNAVHAEGNDCYLLFPWEYAYYQVSANFLVPLVAIITLNIILFLIANKHAAKIQSQISSQSIRSRNNKHVVVWFSFLANMKAAKSILLLVGIFLVCWMTFIIITTDNLLCHICHPREMTWISNCINYSSVALNPILYGILNKKIRKEIRAMVLCTGKSTNTSLKAVEVSILPKTSPFSCIL